MEPSESQELIKKIIDWVESSSDFVQCQWPDFISQFMKAATIKAWIDFSILFVVFVAFLLICVLDIYPNSSKKTDMFDQGFLVFLYSLIIPFALLPITAGLINEIHNLVNIYVAPKVYILSQLKHFIG